MISYQSVIMMVEPHRQRDDFWYNKDLRDLTTQFPEKQFNFSISCSGGRFDVKIAEAQRVKVVESR